MFSFGRNSSSVIFSAIAAMGIQFTTTPAFAQDADVKESGSLICQLVLNGNTPGDKLDILKLGKGNFSLPLNGKQEIVNITDEKTGVKLIGSLSVEPRLVDPGYVLFLSVQLENTKKNNIKIGTFKSSTTFVEQPDIANLDLNAIGEIPFYATVN